GDVCVRGDRIAAMGTLGNPAARRRVDATGLVVSPGFIDLLGQSEYLIFLDNRAASKITQGITTELTGEGSLGSAAHREARHLTSRKAYYDDHRVPDWTNLEGYFAAFIKNRSAINLGTFVSAGGVRDHVIGRAAGRYGGSYITHQRSEADRIDASLDEVFRIAREAGVPATIHHLKTAYKQNWGRMPHVLARLERARAEGLDVAADQ